MLAIHTLVFSIIASASAYMVTVPNQSQGWTNIGNQTMSWQRVDTDPLNFTVVLTRQNPSYSQMLAALVDGTLLTTLVEPPSGGWPEGPNFQVNLVKDPTDINTIYAQSSQFTINTTSSATPGSTGTPTGNTPISPPQTATADVNPTSTGVYQGSAPSGAHSVRGVPATLLGAVLLLAAFLV